MILKPRTIIVAGSFAQVSGLLLAGALILIAATNAIEGLMCCLASEREG